MRETVGVTVGEADLDVVGAKVTEGEMDTVVVGVCVPDTVMVNLRVSVGDREVDAEGEGVCEDVGEWDHVVRRVAVRLGVSVDVKVDVAEAVPVVLDEEEAVRLDDAEEDPDLDAVGVREAVG